jgi:hypothetical protein
MSNNIISNEELYNILEDYEQVKDIFSIQKGTSVKYFTKNIYSNEDDNYIFDNGGNIIEINRELNIVKIANGSKIVIVKVPNTIFFARLPLIKLKKEFREELFIKEQKILELNLYCTDLENKLDKCLSDYIKLEKKYINLKNNNTY